jgi:hypothetical protein
MSFLHVFAPNHRSLKALPLPPPPPPTPTIDIYNTNITMCGTHLIELVKMLILNLYSEHRLMGSRIMLSVAY